MYRRLNGETAKQTFALLHQAIDRGLVASCHDLSEGGLAVAAAEMAFAGVILVWNLDLSKVPTRRFKARNRRTTI